MFATTKALAFQRSAEFARRIKKHVFWRRRSSKVCFTLNFWLQSFGAVLCILLLPGKRSKSPGTRDASGGSAFVQKLPCGNILQSVASLVARVFSSVFRVLRNSFSYPHFVRITNTQTVIAFGELWLHSLCNLQVNLRYARLHKPSHLIRKTDGLSTVMLTVPVEF